MKKEFPSFGLSGELIAQGEDITDRWKLVIEEDGFAKRINMKLIGTVVECPHCEREFKLKND